MGINLSSLEKRLEKLESPMEKLPHHVIWILFGVEEISSAQAQGQTIFRNTNESEDAFKARVTSVLDFSLNPIQLVLTE